MGHLKLVSGKLHIEGTSPYYLPAVLSREFLLELLNAAPGEEFFIGDLAQHFVFSDKRRLADTCKKMNSTVSGLLSLYRTHAFKWAAVLNEDNKWRLDDFHCVYDAKVEAGWVDRVVVTSAGPRFCVSADKILTFAEFHWIYGKSIVQHLELKKQQEADRIDDIQRFIQSEVISLPVSVLDANGCVKTYKASGLEAQDPKEWILPEGLTFLAVDQPCSTT